MHPEYREVLHTYAKNQGMPVAEFGYDAETGAIDLEDLERKMDDLTAAVIVQSPNFFGIVDDVKARRGNRAQARRAAGDGLHRGGFAGLAGAAAEADIVAGELQSFAISPSYGGPYRRHHRHARKNSSGRCLAGWSARPPIRTAIARFA